MRFHQPAVMQTAWCLPGKSARLQMLQPVSIAPLTHALAVQVTFSSTQQGSASSLCGPPDATGPVTLQPQRCCPCASGHLKCLGVFACRGWSQAGGQHGPAPRQESSILACVLRVSMVQAMWALVCRRPCQTEASGVLSLHPPKLTSRGFDNIDSLKYGSAPSSRLSTSGHARRVSGHQPSHSGCYLTGLATQPCWHRDCLSLGG